MLTLRDFLPGVKLARPVLRAERFCPTRLTPDAAAWQSERCKARVSVSSYLIGSPESNKMPLPPLAEFEGWYQSYQPYKSRKGRKELSTDVLAALYQAFI